VDIEKLMGLFGEWLDSNPKIPGYEITFGELRFHRSGSVSEGSIDSSVPEHMVCGQIVVDVQPTDPEEEFESGRYRHEAFVDFYDAEELIKILNGESKPRFYFEEKRTLLIDAATGDEIKP